MLTVQEFIKDRHLGIDPLYIDSVWNSLINNNDSKIMITDNLIAKMGLSKTSFNKKLNKFSKNKMCITDSATYVANSKISMSRDNLKMFLSTLSNEYACKVLAYYQTLESVYWKYLKYQMQFKDDKYSELKEENKLLKRTLNSEVKTYTGHIYICATPEMAKNNLFKVGRTDQSLKKRLSTYNTGQSVNNKYYYVATWKCYDSKHLEVRITHVIGSFREIKNREVYKCNLNKLQNILSSICKNYDREITTANDYNCKKDQIQAVNPITQTSTKAITNKRSSLISQNLPTAKILEQLKISIAQTQRCCWEDLLIENSEPCVLSWKDIQADLAKTYNTSISKLGSALWRTTLKTLLPIPGCKKIKWR